MNPSRREFLRLSALAGAGLYLCPRALTASRNTSKDRRLVLLFLEGGNDGLNTVVPYADDLYHRARPKLGLDKSALIPLENDLGLHPQLQAWQSLWEEGQLAILQNVGYPEPNLSHFISRDIWHSGWRHTANPETGWVGRAFARIKESSLPPIALGSAEAPLLLKDAVSSGFTLIALSDLQLESPPHLPVDTAATGSLARMHAAADNAYQTAAYLRSAAEGVPAGTGYPDSSLADRLRLAARFVRAENGPPVCWMRFGGFDTHAMQDGTHRALLQQLADASAAFLRDLARDGSHEKVLLLIYSEFGRRVAENGSAGTDHGAAAPMFALGGGVRGGLHGTAPNLSQLVDGNLSMQLDFRAVFSEALRDWLGWPTKNLFDDSFAAGSAGLGFLS